jgi:hypothetical protein
LNEQITAGDVLFKRLSRIVAAARPGEGDAEPAAGMLDPTRLGATRLGATKLGAAAPDPKALAAAAQAFAERARSRLGALAA